MSAFWFFKDRHKLTPVFIGAHRLSKLPVSISAQCITRNYSTPPSNLVLPPHSEWRSVFSPMGVALRDRVSVANPDTARMIAESFLEGDSIAAGSDKIVIEAFPGDVLLQNSEQYLQYLYSPVTNCIAAFGEIRPTCKGIPMTGYSWDTYSHLEEKGILDEVETVPWENGVHPQLHFITHIPHPSSENNLSLSSSATFPDRTWLFKYGRVPMSFIWASGLDRVDAPPGQALLDAKSALLPYDDHFHPRTRTAQSFRPESRRLGHPLVSANVILMRNNTPLKNAISTLGPGAETLLKVLTDKSLPPEQQVDIMTQ
ncbi:hypothetical protein BC629DRAFT_1445605, partial [Irpex lacteus]